MDGEEFYDLGDGAIPSSNCEAKTAMASAVQFWRGPPRKSYKAFESWDI